MPETNKAQDQDLAGLADRYRASLEVLELDVNRMRTSVEDLCIKIERRKADVPQNQPHRVPEGPREILRDPKLSAGEKKEALEDLEQAARQMMTAADEGMAPERGGVAKNEPDLAEIVRAQGSLDPSQRRKPNS